MHVRYVLLCIITAQNHLYLCKMNETRFGTLISKSEQKLGDIDIKNMTVSQLSRNAITFVKDNFCHKSHAKIIFVERTECGLCTSSSVFSTSFPTNLET